MPRPPLRTRAALALVLPATVAALASCGAGGAEAPEAGLDYVALGDSFSAGPLIGTMAQDPAGCLRSTQNYPHLLAERLEVRSLRDVTCSGATTQDLVASQQLVDGGQAAPQLDALSAATDLVTIGVGGNDHGISGRIRACAESGAACSLAGAAALERDAGLVEARLHEVLREIGRRAPAADVFVVGYPHLVPPDGGSCPAVGLTPTAAEVVGRVLGRLNASLAGAAEAAGATYVDLDEASRDHHVCAGEHAWVNGRRTRPGEAAAYHPFASGMRGVAAVVQDAVVRRGS